MCICACARARARACVCVVVDGARLKTARRAMRFAGSRDTRRHALSANAKSGAVREGEEREEREEGRRGREDNDVARDNCSTPRIDLTVRACSACCALSGARGRKKRLHFNRSAASEI